MQPAQQFNPQEAEQAFITSVRAVFHRWTVLRLAVTNGWGGGNTAQKEEDMILEVLGLFGRGEKKTRRRIIVVFTSAVCS